MSGLMYHRDHPLDEDAARSLIRQQFPQVTADTVEHLGDGCDFDAYEVDGHWVFRFPKRGDYAPLLLKEFALLDEMGPRLSLPAPLYQFKGEPYEQFPWPFGGYEKLPGASYLRTDLPRHAHLAIARDLGEFLTGLHSVTGEDALGLAVYPPNDEWTMTARREDCLTDLPILRGHMSDDVFLACESFLTDTANDPAKYLGPPTLTHNDLLGEHLLVSPDGSGVSGIIDWSDASAGDPAADFVGLWCVGGDESLDAALAAYACPVDDGLATRVRFNGTCVAIEELAYGVQRGRQLFVDTSIICLTRAFALSG